MTDSRALATLAAATYVRLTTFRRDGTPVPTPVWLVRDGDQLLVITSLRTGKVKRIRHTPRVLLAPCDRRGRVASGVADVEAVAEIVTDPAELTRLRGLLKARYGIGYTMAMLVQRLTRVTTTTDGAELRLSLAGPAPS